MSRTEIPFFAKIVSFDAIRGFAAIDRVLAAPIRWLRRLTSTRPMKLVKNDYDGKLWFFTKRSAEKVMEAAGEQAVCVTFESPKAQIYVSLSGRARLSSDPQVIEKFWNPCAAAWFPEGKGDPDVVLLGIAVYKGEHWKNDESSILKLVEYAKGNVAGGRPDLGENQKFG